MSENHGTSIKTTNKNTTNIHFEVKNKKQLSLVRGEGGVRRVFQKAESNLKRNKIIFFDTEMGKKS